MTSAPGVRRLPAPFGARAWLVDLSGPVHPHALRALSADEQDRAARFVFDEHRRRYQIAHGALRAILGQELGIAPAALEFRAGTHGKPWLPEHPDCIFNMSHSDEIALIALMRDSRELALGVDIEVVREVRDADALAALHFTVGERAELVACPIAARDRLFLSGWTRKEACLKAVGSGLSIAPSTFECGLAPRHATTRISVGSVDADVVVESLQTESGHVAAIATATSRRPR